MKIFWPRTNAAELPGKKSSIKTYAMKMIALLKSFSRKGILVELGVEKLALV